MTLIKFKFNIPNTSITPHTECTRGDFKCDNGICIPSIWLCDGQDDCKVSSETPPVENNTEINYIQDNSDERNCGFNLNSPSTSNTNSIASLFHSFTNGGNSLAAMASAPQAVYVPPPPPAAVAPPPPPPQPVMMVAPQPPRQQIAQRRVQPAPPPSLPAAHFTYPAYAYYQRPPFTPFGNFYRQHNTVYRYRL